MVSVRRSHHHCPPGERAANVKEKDTSCNDKERRFKKEVTEREREEVKTNRALLPHSSANTDCTLSP